MTFVTTGLAIAGLVAMAIPILIHLLWRQRRTPVQWAAIRFLIEAYRKQRRRLQVEQILLLLVRCLILGVLGFALARPLLQEAGLLDGGGSRDVFFIIDDGLASGLTSPDAPDRTSLDAQVEQAHAILAELGPADRVGIVTAARPARALLAPPSSDLAAVGDLLDALQPQESPTDVAGALSRLAASLEDAGEDLDRTFVYLLSDFRVGSAPLEEGLRTLPGAIAERTVLLAAPPATEPATNTQITAIEPARTLVLSGAMDGSGQLTVRLARSGGDLESDVSRVRVTGDAITRLEPKTVQWAPGQNEASVDFQLDFTAPREQVIGLTASIEDDRLDADNQRHLTLELRKQVRVLLIDRRSFGFESSLDRLSTGQWVRRALEPSEASPMELIEVEPVALDVADLRSSDVAVLPRPDLVSEDGWTLLASFVQRGGVLIVVPPGEVNVHQWTDHLHDDLGLTWKLDREVREFPDGLMLADEQPSSILLRMITSDLDALVRPIVTVRTLPVDVQAMASETVLRFADGSALLVAGTPAPDADATDADSAAARGGLVVYLATSLQLDWTNLPSKPLMVPLLHELVRQGLGLVRSRGELVVGGQRALSLGPSAAALVSPTLDRIMLDEGGRPERPLSRQGVYRVADRARQDLGAVAVNVDGAAGRTDAQPAAAVQAWLQRSGAWSFVDAGDLAAPLRTAETGSPIAGLLLLVLLALVVLEIALARWFSHAYRTSGSDVGGGILPSMDTAAGGAG